MDITRLQLYLKQTLAANTTLYVLHESQTPPRPYGPTSGFTVDHCALKPAMDLARAVKSQYEIAQIREANWISSEAHRHVQRHIKSLTSEAQVENLFLAKCREFGAKKQVIPELHTPNTCPRAPITNCPFQAYPVIAGSGPNAATLHYGANNQNFDDRQLMVLDAGAEFGCYASDVTRTFPLNGAFTPEAKEVYAIVEEMQEACISMIKPGASWLTITAKAQLVALDGLKRLGILRSGPAGEPPFIRVVRAFFHAWARTSCRAGHSRCHWRGPHPQHAGGQSLEFGQTRRARCNSFQGMEFCGKLSRRRRSLLTTFGEGYGYYLRARSLFQPGVCRVVL